LVEVTSDSTEDYDRGEKLAHYKQLPSLGAVLIVSHRRAQITVHERRGDGWEQREHRAGEQLVVSDPAFSLSISDVYDGIEL
jgi:Uma2 family endonuclease